MFSFDVEINEFEWKFDFARMLSIFSLTWIVRGFMLDLALTLPCDISELPYISLWDLILYISIDCLLSSGLGICKFVIDFYGWKEAPYTVFASFMKSVFLVALKDVFDCRSRCSIWDWDIDLYYEFLVSYWLLLINFCFIFIALWFIFCSIESLLLFDFVYYFDLWLSIFENTEF